jgi:Flp pilus assembly protein TadG
LHEFFGRIGVKSFTTRPDLSAVPSIRRLARAWIRFQRESRGDVAIIFALALIPILAFVGAAIDYSRASHLRADLQTALDSTALMVLKNAASQSSGYSPKPRRKTSNSPPAIQTAADRASWSAPRPTCRPSS